VTTIFAAFGGSPPFSPFHDAAGLESVSLPLFPVGGGFYLAIFETFIEFVLFGDFALFM